MKKYLPLLILAIAFNANAGVLKFSYAHGVKPAAKASVKAATFAKAAVVKSAKFAKKVIV